MPPYKLHRKCCHKWQNTIVTLTVSPYPCYLNQCQYHTTYFILLTVNSVNTNTELALVLTTAVVHRSRILLFQPIAGLQPTAARHLAAVDVVQVEETGFRLDLSIVSNTTTTTKPVDSSINTNTAINITTDYCRSMIPGTTVITITNGQYQ